MANVNFCFVHTQSVYSVLNNEYSSYYSLHNIYLCTVTHIGYNGLHNSPGEYQEYRISQESLKVQQPRQQQGRVMKKAL
jgi:hypothetical protein